MNSDILFPESIISKKECWNAPLTCFPGESDSTAHYHPILDHLFLPKSKNLFVNLQTMAMEEGHWKFNTWTSRCFLRTIPALIHKEYFYQMQLSGFKFATIYPDNNHWIWCLKELFGVVNSLLEPLEELFALLNSELGISAMVEGKDQAEDIKSYIAGKLANDLGQFRDLYSTYSEISNFDSLEFPEYILFNFALNGPSYMPKLSFTEFGTIDSSKLTRSKAQKLVEDFKKHYSNFPYSPIKRFYFAVEKMKEISKKSNVPLEPQEVLAKLKRYDKFDPKQKPQHRGCAFCPLVELLNHHGLSLVEPWGRNIVNIHCREYMKESFRKLSSLQFYIEDKGNDNALIHRNPPYFREWPFTAAFTALEYLRHLTFYSQRSYTNKRKIVLTDYVSDQELTQDVLHENVLIRERDQIVEKVLPFVTVKLYKVKQSHPRMEIALKD